MARLIVTLVQVWLLIVLSIPLAWFAFIAYMLLNPIR
jgi:hypothetical protein